MLNIKLEVDWQKQIIQLQDMSGLWSLAVVLQIDQTKIKGEFPMAVTITDLQKVRASISPKDARGNPAPLDGIPTWEVGDAMLLNVTPSENGLSAMIAAAGGLGTTQVIVRADARLGPDVVELTGILDVEVIGSEAVTLEITTGIPEPL